MCGHQECPNDGPGVQNCVVVLDVPSPFEIIAAIGLGPLQNNVGPTETHALLPRSLALDAGNAACTDANGNPLTTDQRGLPRPVDGNGDGVAVCDIGAFELQHEVIDFEGLPAGKVVKKVYADSGFGPIHVRGNLGNACTHNAAVVFDSSCPSGVCSGDDQDLGTPNETFSGPGEGKGGEVGSPWANDTSLGKLLIVHEACHELTDHIVEEPDDTEGASKIALRFPQPVSVFSYTILDNERDERDKVKLYNSQGERLATLSNPATGNNGKAVVQTSEDGMGISGVTRMVFDREGSRGLDNIVFLPEGPVQSCESRYSPGMICEEDARSCRFYVILGGGTCADYCESRGGRCLDAASDANNGCEVEEQRPCDNSAGDQICECSL